MQHGCRLVAPHFPAFRRTVGAMGLRSPMAIAHQGPPGMTRFRISAYTMNKRANFGMARLCALHLLL